MLNSSDIRTLERFTDSATARKWEGLIRKMSAGNTITVANTGLFSSGKSTLFNAMLGRVDDERFPVGAAPTTKTGDRETLEGDIVLLDTPGIDSNNREDDAEAFDMVMQSDIIIMTHNIKIGMLNRAEYDWLKRIVSGMDSTALRQRLMFAATWSDSRTDAGDLEKVIAELKAQILEATGGQEIAFYAVSAKRFYTAQKKDNTKLREVSGVDEFREKVIEFAVNYAGKAQALRRNELNSLCSSTMGALITQKVSCEESISNAKSRVRSRYEGAFETWRGILSRFKGMKSGVMSKLSEVKANSSSSWEYDNFESRIYNM